MDQIPPGADLSIIPLATNPSEDPSNFVNLDSRAHIPLAVGVSLGSATFLFVAARPIANLKNNRRLFVDDDKFEGCRGS